MNKNNSSGILQNLRSKLDVFLSFRIVDDHCVIRLFGLKFCKKFKVKINLPQIISSGITSEKRNPKLIVSLTTFPLRINTVYQTITTLLNQTFKPDKVILWLAEEQFTDKKLPENLTKLQQFGLTIKWCNEDIKSFKKLIPALKEYPDDIIITADDDIFYPQDFVESLYKMYLSAPECIHANRAFVIKKSGNKYLIKARGYVKDKTYEPHYINEFMTGYGTLFPPHCLHNDIFDKNLYMNLMPTNDDVWFWGMAVRNNYKINVNPKGFKLRLVIDRNVQDCGLWKMNMKNSVSGINGSDAVTILCRKYPDIEERLLTELKEL